VHHDAKLVVAAGIVNHSAEAEAGKIRYTAAHLSVSVQKALHTSLPKRILVGELEARLFVRMRVLEF